MAPKYLSGYQKIKRKQREEDIVRSQAGDINKYFNSNNKIARDNLTRFEQEIHQSNENGDKEVSQSNIVNELDEEDNDNENGDKEVSQTNIVNDLNEDDNDNIVDVQHENPNQESLSHLNFDDPGK